MAKQVRRADRRGDALNRERIVDATIELLDAEGEAGFTFRALADKLATGAGAIYWHVTNKSELVAAAADVIVAGAIANVATDAAPQPGIRAVALGVFEAIDAHPWVGPQLSRAPWQSATLEIFERIGRLLQALGVPRAEQFTAASTLVTFIVGVGSQNAANARMLDAATHRDAFVGAAAAGWAALDAASYAFTRSMAGPLRDHDDREEFLRGIDLIVAGIASRAKPEKPRGR